MAVCGYCGAEIHRDAVVDSFPNLDPADPQWFDTNGDPYCLTTETAGYHQPQGMST